MSFDPDIIPVDPKQAEEEGRKRRAVHEKHGTPRFFKDSATEDILGVTAELAFAKWSGLKANLDIKPRGDGGLDFSFTTSGRKLKIDVKGARAPLFLLLKVEEAKQASDILILSQVDPQSVVWFLGWEHKTVMLISPSRYFSQGIISFYRHHSELRPMWQLRRLMGEKPPPEVDFA